MKKITNVAFILDKSGSMDVIKDSTISGFNEYIKTLKKDKKSSYLFTLTMFDTEISTPILEKKITDIDDLNDKTYNPSGMTALYDAVVTTVKKIENKKDKMLVVIMTDGEENSSREYTQENLKSMVKKLEAKKNWSFVFLGANQDSWLNAQKFGFNKGNVVNFVASNQGVKNAMRNVGMSTMSFSASACNTTQDFFQGKENIDEE